MNEDKIPKERYYTEEQEWVQVIKEEKGHVYIGITHFLEQELGDIYEVCFDVKAGDKIEKGEVLGYLDTETEEHEFHMPVSGKIVQLNADLESTPENINFDPYEEGWILKIKIDSNNEFDSLLNSEEYLDEFDTE